MQVKNTQYINRQSFIRFAVILSLAIAVLVGIRLTTASSQYANGIIPCSDDAFLTQGIAGDNTKISEKPIYEHGLDAFQDINPDLLRTVNAIGLSANLNAFFSIEPDTGRLFQIGPNPAGTLPILLNRPNGMGQPNILKNNIPPYPDNTPRRGKKHSGYFAGDVRNFFLPAVNGGAPDGYLYTFNLGNGVNDDGTLHTMFAINVAAPQPLTNANVKAIDMNAANADSPGADIAMNDWAFNPKNGWLYGYDSNTNKILRVNPENGNVQNVTTGLDLAQTNLKNYPLNASKRPPGNGYAGTSMRMGASVAGEGEDAHGAAWFDAEGNFYTYRNYGAEFKVPIRDNGFIDAQNIEEYPAKQVRTNDGAACPAVEFTKTANPSTITDGQSTTYIYDIKNSSSTQTMVANFEDDMRNLPGERTFVNTPGVSPVLTGFTAPTPAAQFLDGNKRLRFDGLRIPPAGSGRITVTVQTPTRFIDEQEVLKNTARLTNISLPGLQNLSDREASADLTVTPLPGVYKYMKIYGNDVAAGGGFGSICNPLNPQATIKSFAIKKDVGGGVNHWVGSSSQFATSAAGEIDRFYTANMRGPIGASNLPRPPLDLTIGNTTNGTSLVASNQGGNSTATCIKDYFDNPDIQFQAGDTINSRVVNETVHEALYYDRDVYITGTGVSFQDGNGSWGAEINNIPSFYLIVRGNIYIHPSVTQLDGVYIAQPIANGTKGLIYTCAFPGGAPVGLNDCNNKLTINGAFIAKQVRFLRTGGDLSVASGNEAPGSGNIAEVFNFSPEVFLSPLDSSLIRSTPYSKYDYITSLPPVL